MIHAKTFVYYGAFLVALIIKCTDVQCCYNNQRLGFCPPSRQVFQKMCPGVTPWGCNYVELACMCVRNTFRTNDGRCVAKEDCGEPPQKKEQKPKQTKPPEILLPNHPISSAGASGCPHNPEECAEECKKQNYMHGYCDAVVPNYCYCTGLSSSSTLPRRQALSEDENPKNWPYGEVSSTREIVRELRESYGCPARSTECLSECRQHGYFRAFCQRDPPNHCFCWALASKYNWREQMLRKLQSANQVQDAVRCENKEICEQRCLSTGVSGGFCTEDTDPLCYCYDMFPYGPHSSETDRRALPPVYKDLVTATTKFMKTTEKIVLVYISTAAWLESDCYCLESTLVEISGTKISRTIGCHAQVHTENGTLMTKTTTTVQFSATFNDGATELKLATESGKLPFDLRSIYKVLSAADTCIVLQIGEVRNGRPLCALWGFENAGNSDEKDCFDTLRDSCKKPHFNAYEERDQCGDQIPLTQPSTS